MFYHSLTSLLVNRRVISRSLSPAAERDIETTFTRQGFPIIQIQAGKVNADIERFVDFEVERRTGDDNFCVIDQTLKDKIKDAICSQSNGM